MSKYQPAKKAGNEKDGKGEDLTTILDKTQRVDLTLLVANITESMRKLILENFDATAGLDTNFWHKESMTEDEKLMNADPASADVEKYDRQKKLKAEYEKDLSTLKMKNLKKNALKAYDEWREQVIMRVGRVVNDEKTAKEQLAKSSPEDSKPKAPDTSGKITGQPNKAANLKFRDLFPPTKTPLTKLSMDRRTLVLHSLLLLLLSLEHYNAASRVFLLNLTSSLKLPLKTFEQDEYVTAKGLLEGAKELSASEETKKKAEENKESRKLQVRAATVAGAAIMGIAGGLAAPLVAAGIGSIATGLGLGTTAAAGYLGTVASSTVLVGSIFGAYGGRMTGQMMDKYAREVEDFEFLPVHSNSKTSEDPEQGAKQASEHDHKLRVTICISGWLTEKEEVIKPWRVLGDGSEVFALKYELEALLNLGNAMNGMVQSAAWGYAQKEMIEQTIFADLMAAMWPLGLLKVARVLDNPFSVAKQRAEKAGEVLADALINRAQGERPVTLIGYSLGARAIYVCLQSLAKRKAFNLIENAVLMGAPTPSDTSDWRVLRSVVSGRLVNVFSSNDYILGFMYRTSAIQYGIAGLQAIEGLPGVENVDVSEEIDGHLRYRFLVGGILKKIGFEDIDMQAVEEEQEALKKMLEEEKKNSLQSQRKRLMRQRSYQGKVDEDAEAEHEASEMEKQVKEKTQRSLVSRVIEWWYTPRIPNAKDAEKVAGNIQRGMTNPSDAGAAVGDTAKGVQSSAQSMAQRVYTALPNIPYMSRSPAGKAQNTAQDPAKVQDAVGKTASDATKPAQTYTEMAASYLPKNLPSRSSLPSMPNLPGMGKQQQKKEPGKGQAVKNAAATTGESAKAVAGGLTDTTATTVKNVANPQDNPAVKQVKQAPIIHQAVEKDPGVTQTLGKVTGAVGKTVNNTVDTTTGAGKNVAGKAEEAGGAAASTAEKGVSGVASKITGKGKSDDSSKKQPQSYSSYAASYIPAMPSMPAMPSWNRASGTAQKKQPPKLERKGSSNVQTPKLQRQSSSDVKTQPPKLGPRKASGLKSPLGRTLSENESVPQLKRLPSGVKSPGSSQGLKSPPSLERASSGIQSPPAAAGGAKAVANAPQQAVKKTGDAASAGQQAAKSGAETATNAAGGFLGGAKRMVGFGSK